MTRVPQTRVESSILGRTLSFDANGDVDGATFYIFQIKNGEYELVEG